MVGAAIMNNAQDRWRKVPSFFGRLRDELSFAAKKKSLLGPPGEPLFDAETLALYNALIADPSTRTYVEFGSGGATLIAARNVEFLVSVESDPYYQELVETSVTASHPKADVRLLHGDIGPTGGWGAPILRAGGYAFSGKKYVQAPWTVLEREQRNADFVLVDGRFRVACVCASLLNPRASGAVVLLDDFAGRTPYEVVLDFADVVERKGRSVLLRRKSDIDVAGCEAVLKKHMRRPY